MTKSLTEQWREGTLKDAEYYVKNKSNNVVVDYYCETTKSFATVFPFNVKEVLAPVPSYEEYKELLRHSELSRNLVYEVLVNQKEYNELLDKAKENTRLQEQLNEANELLKAYGTESLWESLSLSYDEANEYCKKWGVK